MRATHLLPALLLLSGTALAAEVALDVPGWRIAGVGVTRPGAAAAPCAACHAIDGGGVGGAMPRVGALDRAYLVQSMKSYADGSRENAVMGNVARAMTEGEIEAVSAWFASTDPVWFPQRPADAGLVEAGRAIADRGVPAAGVNACASCHGDATGKGVLYAVPYLQGQFPSYIRLQFRMWGRGLRNGDPDRVMNAIAKKLDDGQVEAVARYYGGLRPPSPRPAETVAGGMR